MDLKLLRYFVVLAEELHFANAAARLNIAQPSLSIQIREMERRLGGQLFIRTKRHVELTKAGEQFLADARDVLERAERAERHIEGVFRGVFGRIDIGFSSLAAYSGLMRRTVRAIRDHAPGLEVMLHELEPRAQIAALLARKIDIALTPTLAIEIPETVSRIRVADWPLEVAMSEDHPLAARDSIQRDALRDQHFIAYASPHFPTQPRVFEEVLGFAPVSTQSANSASLVLAMIGTGLGVSLLPRVLEDLGAMNFVKFRPIAGQDTRVDLSLLVLRDAPHPVTPALLAAMRTALDVAD